jgi:hypothetical protein
MDARHFPRSHARPRFFSAATTRSFPSTHFLPFLSTSAASHLHGTSYHHARGGGGRAATVMASSKELPRAGCSGCRSPIADGRVRGASMVAGRLRGRVLGVEVGPRLAGVVAPRCPEVPSWRVAHPFPDQVAPPPPRAGGRVSRGADGRVHGSPAAPSRLGK